MTQQKKSLRLIQFWLRHKYYKSHALNNCILTAVISELYHPDDIAIARLAEEFGPTPAKFIDFQRDNSGNSVKFSAILVFIALIFVL